jgi:cell wall integrity and stress response component
MTMILTKTIGGGLDKLWVQLTGEAFNKVPNFTPSATLSSTSTSTSVAQSTQKSSTVVSSALATNTPSTTPVVSHDGGPNKVGIAVGAVVGVLVLAAIIGGVFFFLRQKRRREVEDEFRRQANINSFTAGGKLHTSNSSMTDSRLDPEFMARRASNGSIADNEDYSRRILKV